MDFSFPETEPHEWKKLGFLLNRAAYSTAAVRELIGVRNSSEEILSGTGRYSLFHLDRLSQMKDPIGILAILFMLSGRVALPDLRILDPELLDTLWRLGLIEEIPESPNLLRGTVNITELQRRYFLSDQLFENLGGEIKVSYRADSCMPPHASSLELMNVLRKPEKAPSSFLDVGCGSGCQSIAFASDYDLVDGLDPSVRSVSFARINALLNGCKIRYVVNNWESFEPVLPYGHIAFNAPDAPTAIALINEGLSKMLAKSGVAQISLECEITKDEGSVASALENRIRHPDEWQIRIHEHAHSPLSLSRKHIEIGQLPGGSLLVDDPAQKMSFFHNLTERKVVEIMYVTLSIQHR
jgi:SAM-dependent methyltransferase